MDNTAINIAIAENHVLLGTVLQNALSSRGYNVIVTAENGAELLTQMKSLKELPDLCIVDITMPVMDGYETVRQLRKEYPSVKILAMTIFDHIDKRDAILAAGAHEYIVKNEPIENWETVIAGLFAS
ncbi:MAG: response regulator transcription factor [Agriterribacter sp.]